MSPQIRNTPVPGGFLDNPVLVAGDGPPLVYLHGAFGQEWDGLLDDLAQDRTVYAPLSVGSDDPDELARIDGVADLSLYYDDLFDALGLQTFDLVGHSFGGMAAAEYAALFPHRVRRLVLIDPLGLWNDETPVQDHFLVSETRRLELLYHDPLNAEVRRKLAPPADPAQILPAMLRRLTGLAGSGHFLWPIPDRGLQRRLRRIAAETLILWGAQDRWVPPVYADEFEARIARSTVRIIEQAGHCPHVEQRAAVSAAVRSFLADVVTVGV